MRLWFSLLLFCAMQLAGRSALWSQELVEENFCGSLPPPLNDECGEHELAIRFVDTGTNVLTYQSFRPGMPIKVAIDMVNPTEGTQGWSYAVTYDKSMVALAADGITVVDTDAGASAGRAPFFLNKLVEGGFISGIVLNVSSGVVELPVGNNTILFAEFALAANAGFSGTQLRFANNEIGVPDSPPVEIVITSQGRSLSPRRLTHGLIKSEFDKPTALIENFCVINPESVECTGDQLAITFATGNVANDSKAVVDRSSVHLYNTFVPRSAIVSAVTLRPVDGLVNGWSFSVQHDPAILTLAENGLSLRDTATEANLGANSFVENRVGTNGYSSIVILDQNDPLITLPDTENVILLATYTLDADADDGTELRFVEEGLDFTSSAAPQIAIHRAEHVTTPQWLIHGRVSRAEGASPDAGAGQLPGDCTLDGRLNIADAICIFTGLLAPLNKGRGDFVCGDGTGTHQANRWLLDFDGDRGETVTFLDGIALLNHLFTSGPRHSLGTSCIQIAGCPSGVACEDS